MISSRRSARSSAATVQVASASLADFKLTIRDGPKVTREGHDSLDEAMAAMREHARRIRSAGNLPEVKMFRTYEPGDRVKARLEISTGGFMRRRDAGLDVMGDGALVPFRGGVRRTPIEASADDGPFELVEAALRADT